MNTTITHGKMLAAVGSAALAATVGLLLAPAASAADSAVATIDQLETEGFDVNIDRVGSAPLSECTVTSVRNPQEQTQVVRVDGRGERDRFIDVVVNRTIMVSLDCSSR